MQGLALTPWQMCGLALVLVIIGMVVGTYLKRAEKPDQKRKNDK